MVTTYTVIVSNVGLEHPLLSSIPTVSKLKEEIENVTGIPIKRQILLMEISSLNVNVNVNDHGNISYSGSSASGSSESVLYTVPKDSILQQQQQQISYNHDGSDGDDYKKVVMIYLFDRDDHVMNTNENVGGIRTDVKDILHRIQHIQGANVAAWGNYRYHKQNFLKLERVFSNQFLQYDAEQAQPLLTSSSSEQFSEEISRRSKAVELEKCLIDFFGEEYKNLYDTIPIEKILQWHEFCIQSRDVLCGKYYEVHSFAESLLDEQPDNMEEATLIQFDDLTSDRHQQLYVIDDVMKMYKSAQQQLFQNLTKIRNYQTSIRSSKDAINFLKDAMNKHSEHLEYLNIVINWPDVFQDINKELKRRASYSALLQQNFDELEYMQAQEVTIRQQFINDYRSKCMPLFADVIYQMPSPLNFSRKENLPAYDIPVKETKVSSSVAMEEEILRLKKDNERLQKRTMGVDQANTKVKELEHQLYSTSNKISHTSFQVNDVALFMPTGRKVRRNGSEKKYPIYLAFHSHTPHRYLSHDSLPLTETLSAPDYVLGRIILVDECLSAVGKKNEYGVPPGLKYWVLTVEVVKKP